VLISGALNSSILSIVLVTTGGYTVTIPSGTVSGFSMSQDASESVKVNFDFSSSGSFTVA
jgi:hypothetical protein